MENGVVKFVVRGLNTIAWFVLGVIVIGVAIAYFTDHQITIVHNENPQAASAATDIPDYFSLFEELEKKLLKFAPADMPADTEVK